MDDRRILETMTIPKATLGSLMRNLRNRRGLTLKQMSTITGIPFSTLAKVEHDRLTLTFDKLQMVSERLNIRMADLFAEPDTAAPAIANSRRSVATLANALSVATANYDYHYLSPELRQKDMIPIVSRVKARSLAEFGDLVRHDGQEFLYVLSGRIVVHTEFYGPAALAAGESIYIDSRMGHAYVLSEGCDEALALCVCSTTQEELLDNASRQMVTSARPRPVLDGRKKTRQPGPATR